ncbi:P pilus assembly/Cpx signaling pathway, periplasmic inhibitor/zinc-resistance associated protein [Fischerella thermalis CCMEE 5198]|jgi:Spy/CpxP family protein refolding chaperone|uniref:Spy/CpxP family protein refolding chaperone n=1 Tax=Fischerella thermalis TaxID=372787 RepID=UPI000C80FDE3|nr:Spy/CpxP family protein refolding chaperone [Fischerella thermalis]PLZ95185.1 P pilus assembly/Cpx signaling pathway, periplasmic inhibitor/zinc-resistance associated protein [Fischerella thermalis CCMEE 5196]PMB20377.1 P pilus assembly/Cpx signaling pathway, periplasmic inhibitor/zinc-resistance associated protein [Fischerella thermalis CCMEE 5198]
MTLKKLSLIAGAVVLSLTALPFAVQAQTTPSPFLVAQVPQGKGPLQSLGLTDAQKAQIAEIRRNTKAKMDAVLTPQQREQLANARQNRQNRRNLKASLNLTEDQKAQMRQIMESQKSQIDAVLTPEQRQQLQQMRESKRSRRQQFNR